MYLSAFPNSSSTVMGIWTRSGGVVGFSGGKMKCWPDGKGSGSAAAFVVCATGSWPTDGGVGVNGVSGKRSAEVGAVSGYAEAGAVDGGSRSKDGSKSESPCWNDAFWVAAGGAAGGGGEDVLRKKVLEGSFNMLFGVLYSGSLDGPAVTIESLGFPLARGG